MKTKVITPTLNLRLEKKPPSLLDSNGLFISFLYFLNMDISLDIYFPTMKLCTVGQKILLERSLSQNVEVLFLILCKTNQKKTTAKKREIFSDLLRLNGPEMIK